MGRTVHRANNFCLLCFIFGSVWDPFYLLRAIAQDPWDMGPILYVGVFITRRHTDIWDPSPRPGFMGPDAGDVGGGCVH